MVESELFMMMINASAERWSGCEGEESRHLRVRRVCVSECECVSVSVRVRVMMMNGGLSPLALPVSTACKHREIIWADTLSCSLMH